MACKQTILDTLNLVPPAAAIGGGSTRSYIVNREGAG
jgi:hypothetical protein